VDQFVIVWDSSVVTEKDYADIVTALGDLVRASGGAGVERIREKTFLVSPVRELPANARSAR
jgi:hypothetical protein